MTGVEIVTVNEALEWTRLDYDENKIKDLIQIAYDNISDSVDNFESKLKSAKFRRKLKLCILNSVVDMYNNRGITTDKENKLKYINQTMLFQLQYNTYLESDV